MSRSNIVDRRSTIEASYQRSESRSSNQFGNYTVYRNPQTKATLICKDFIYNSDDMAESHVRHRDYLLSLTHPYLINLLDYSVNLERGLCARRIYIREFYEAPVQNLQSFLTKQKVKHNFRKVPMELLTHLMYQMIEVNAWFQSKNIYHGNICPSTVMLNSIGTFKLFYKDGRTPERVQLEKLLREEPIYMSPKLYQSFRNKVFDKISHVPCKSDVFSLGIVLLEAGLLHNVQQIYEPNGTLNTLSLSRYVREFGEIYQDNPLLLSSVKRMVEINETARPDFASLKSAMPSYDKIKAYFSNMAQKPYPDNKLQKAIRQEQLQNKDQFNNDAIFNKAFDKNEALKINNYGVSKYNVKSQNNFVQHTTDQEANAKTPTDGSKFISDHTNKIEKNNVCAKRPQSVVTVIGNKRFFPSSTLNHTSTNIENPNNEAIYTGRIKIIGGKRYREKKEERVTKLQNGDIIRKDVYVLVEDNGSLVLNQTSIRPTSNTTNTFTSNSFFTEKDHNLPRRPMSQNYQSVKPHFRL